MEKVWLLELIMFRVLKPVRFQRSDKMLWNFKLHKFHTWERVTVRSSIEKQDDCWAVLEPCLKIRLNNWVIWIRKIYVSPKSFCTGGTKVYLRFLHRKSKKKSVSKLTYVTLENGLFWTILSVCLFFLRWSM